jgi:uncharacterized membrane protein YfcA
MDAFLPHYTVSQWLVLILAALLTGMAKAGLKGFSMFVVPLMAASFSGRPSTGLLLPLLCIADVFAVRHYHKHADPKYLFRLLPPAMIGVLVATAVGSWVSDQVFTNLIAWTIMATVVLLIVQESVDLSGVVAQQPVIGYCFGGLGGFTTMIGNAAGPVMAVYLLATRIPKNNYMGTIAWFFLIINVFKLPWHLFVWQTINIPTLAANALVVPAIFIGVRAGIAIVSRIPERAFRYLVIAMTAVMALKLLLDGLLY